MNESPEEATQSERLEERMAERGVVVRINSSDKRQRATLWLRHPQCYWCCQETIWTDALFRPGNAATVIRKRPARQDDQAKSYVWRRVVACQDCADLRAQLEKLQNSEEKLTQTLARVGQRRQEIERQWAERRKQEEKRNA
jgi:hypothetical protein